MNMHVANNKPAVLGNCSLPNRQRVSLRRSDLRKKVCAVTQEVPLFNEPADKSVIEPREPTAKPALPEYTLAEVALHNKEDDCWIVVENKVYDITGWLAKHPGGSMIMVNAGMDCTHLFGSYHFSKAKKALNRYEMGRLAPQEPTVSYLNDLDDPFYEDMKARVAKYFKDTNQHPRFHWHMYIKTAFIISNMFAGYVLAHYAAPALGLGLGTSFLAAAWCGVFMALIGTAIQHDANHGAYHPSPKVNYVVGMSIDMVGKSSKNWKMQHVGQHHVYTNVHDYDPDINIEHIMRLSDFQPLKSFHWAQWMYALVLYAFMSLKIKYVDDFWQFFTRDLGTKLKTAGYTTKETVLFWAGKLQFFAWFIGAPLLLSTHSIGTSIALMLTAEVFMAYTLAFMFQLAHVVEGVDMLETEAAKGEEEGKREVNMSWAESQMATTVDFEQGSWFWTHFSGGLNYQTTHHLFPGVSHAHYPAIAPIIEECAAEYGIKYKKAGNIVDAVKKHFLYLKDMGKPAAQQA